MRCVSCDEPIDRLDEPCPHCQFKGDPALVEELTQVNWMLGEIANWTLAAADRHKITQTYTVRHHELEIKLGLTPAAQRFLPCGPDVRFTSVSMPHTFSTCQS